MTAVPLPGALRPPGERSAAAEPVAAAVRTLGAQRVSTARARRRLDAFVVAGDAAGLVVAGFVVAWLCGPLLAASSVLERWAFALAAPAVVLCVMALGRSCGNAKNRIAPRVADELGGIVLSIASGGVVLLALGSVAGVRAWVPPAEVAVLVGVACVAVPTVRELTLAVAGRVQGNASRVVVVGSGFVAGYVADRLSRSHLVEVVGVVDETPVDGYKHLGTIADLPGICRDEEVDRAVIAFSGQHPRHMAQALQELQGSVDIDVVVRYFELANWASRLSDITGLSLLTIGRAPGRGAAAMKRLVDVVVATLALVLAAPALAAAALAVWMESGSPVFFRQTRVGRERRTFRILKLRTMRDAPVGRRDNGLHPLSRPDRRPTPLDTVPDPGRITKVGRVLRRTGLDELPQLVNVLRGEMSLVGPRPFVPEECTSLPDTVRRRFAVRPGMTGLWQVCGQHEVGFDELCRLDVQYAMSWSLRGDLRILARTPGRLLRGSR